MKLLLTSGGFTTKEIINSFARLCGKDITSISMAIINEAYAVEIGDQRWVTEELNHVATTVGGEINIINLHALNKEEIQKRIMKMDAIYVLGGHTDYQIYVFNKSGLSELLPDLLKEKVYVGSSAGSMVLCKRVSTAAYEELYGEGENYEIHNYLEFADFAIKPHLNSPHFLKVRIENLVKISETFDSRIFGLQDDQAIEVNGAEIKFIGGHPLELLNGEIISDLS
jgi:dipeptidase E